MGEKMRTTTKQKYRLPFLVAASAGLAGAVSADARAAMIFPVLVTNRAGNTVQQLDSGGSRSIFTASGLSNPQGIAVDAARNVYVANANNVIEQFSSAGTDLGRFATASTGTASVFASSGLNGPDSIAFQVPEPSAGRLLAAGIAALCVTARRRSRGAEPGGDKGGGG
jgi:hypothetical protein